MIKFKVLLLTLGLAMTCFRSSEGHGYLMDPPARSSMWREQFPVPPNYNDNQLNCGGYYNQWSRNRGKCGICGDPFEQAQPRDNESRGKYGKGIVSRAYAEGQEVTFKVMITANHYGWFEFRLCPDGSPSTPVTEACLDRYVLQLADGSGTRFDLGSAINAVSVRLRLPAGVTCSQCVVQWKWHAGNNFGINPDMTSCRGCGPQEEFYGCADIAITGTGSSNVSPTFPNPPVTNPATFATVQFDTYPSLPNAQGQTTQRPTRPSLPVTVKPGGSGGFMPITLPPRDPQTVSTRSTAKGNDALPSSFKPITARPTVGPITFVPQPTAGQTTQNQTPRPTNGNLPSSYKPITARPTVGPITFAPQSTARSTRSTQSPLTQPTSNNMPSSYKPITARPPVGPITFTTQPTVDSTTQDQSTQSTNNNMPSSYKPITARPPVGPITFAPKSTVTFPALALIAGRTTQFLTPRPTNSNLPSSYKPITPRPSVCTITFAPQPTVTLPPTAARTVKTTQFQTPRPTNGNLPSSYKPISTPITFTPQPIVTAQRTTAPKTRPTVMPVSYQPITPRNTAAPITTKPKTTPQMIQTMPTIVRTTQRQTPRPIFTTPIGFQPITLRSTTPPTRSPITTPTPTTSTQTLAPFIPVSAKGPFVPLTYTPTAISTLPTNPTPKQTTRPFVVTFFRPSPTTTKKPTTTPTTTTTTPTTTTTTPTTTTPTTVKPIVFPLGSTTVAPPPNLIQGKRCYAINSWAGNLQLDQWCQAQCNTLGGTCPPEFCECV